MSSAATDSKPFFRDLRAAVRAGVKLEIGEGESPSKALTVKSLDRLESEHDAGNDLPKRLADAMLTWGRTGSMIPILEALSSRHAAWKRIGSLFRRSLLYLLLIAAVAIAGLAWYVFSILPEIDAVRQDLIQIAKPVETVEPISVGFWAAVALVCFVLVFVVATGWLLRGGMTRAGWWLGAEGYIRYETLATASRAVQALVATGETPQEAALIGGRLTGLDAATSGELLASVAELDREAILQSEWSDYLRMMARQQYISARAWGPTTMVIVVGGFFALLYVLIAWLPITSLIFELSHSSRA